MNDISKNFVDLFSIPINFIDPFSSDPFWQSLIDVLDDGTSINDIRDEWDNHSITYNGQSYNIQTLINSPSTYQDIENNPDLTALQKTREKHKREWTIFSGGYQHFKRAKMKAFYNATGCEDTSEILPDQEDENDLLNPNNTNYNDQKDDALDALGSTTDCEEWARIKAESLVFGAYGEDASCQGWNGMTQTQRQELIDALVPDLKAYCEGSLAPQTIAINNQFRKLYYDQGCFYLQFDDFFTFVENNPNNTDPYNSSILENDILKADPLITSYRMVKWFEAFMTTNSMDETKRAFKAYFNRLEPQTGADPANPFHYTEAEWNNLAPSIILAYIELSIRATASYNCLNDGPIDATPGTTTEINNLQGKATNDALTRIKTSIQSYTFTDDQGNTNSLCLTPFYAMLSPISCRAYTEETMWVRDESVPVNANGVADVAGFEFGHSAPSAPLENLGIEIPENTAYDNLLQNGFTLEAIIKPEGLSQTRNKMTVMSSGYSDPQNEETYFEFGIKWIAEGQYKLFHNYKHRTASGQLQTIDAISNPFTFTAETSCIHVAFSSEAGLNALTNDRKMFYVNGNAIAYGGVVSNISFGSPSTPEGSLIGNTFTVGSDFKGIIQELRIWNNYKQEADLLYTNSVLPTSLYNNPNLLGYWKLQRNNNNRIIDYSTQANDILFRATNCDGAGGGTGGCDPTGVYPAEIAQTCLVEIPMMQKTVRVCSAYDDNFSDLSTHYTMDDVMAACVENTLVNATKETIRIRKEQRNVLSNRLDEKYNNDCFKSPFKEHLTMTYTSSEHHYTLYYYDQAGNLYQTVPPEGVTTNGSGSHTLKTEYHYNTLGQVVWQKTPDGGESQMWVDYYGRVRLSQNQEQAVLHADRQDTHFEYAYSKYDDLGRPYEAGKISILPDAQGKDPLKKVAIDELVFSNNFPEQVTSANIIAPTPENSQATISLSFELSERTVTYYDNAQINHPEGEYIVNPTQQHYLRNRVAAVAVYEEGTTIGAVTRYSYDIHGNVENVWQRLPKVAISANTAEDVILPEKNVSYIYDLLSGKVNQVVFQEGGEDEFRHRYDYDGDNRLTGVHTSLDGIHWTLEAKYFYYAHGPLARVEVGEHNIQGVDYYYTLQGWIKGVNSPEGTFGKDGTAENPSFNTDEFAYSLHYFEGDYKARGTNSILGTAFTTDENYNNFKVGGNDPNFVGFTDQISSVNYNRESLYNGNVAAMTTSIKHFGDAGQEATQSMNYRYDQLHRIAAANAMTWDGTKWNQQGSRYQTAYKYDENGNIQNLQRRNQAGTQIDKLVYQYDPVKKNQLFKVTDQAANVDNTNPSANGLDKGAVPHIYEYDDIGNLIKNESDGIQNIVWNIQGKVEQVTRGIGANETVITYRYDASGNRIIKQVTKGITIHINYYLRDVTGNVMAIYEDTRPSNTTITDNIALKEIPIYGSARLGQYRPLKQQTGQTEPHKKTALGQRIYEFSNHLGNVLVTLNDFKVPDLENVGHYKAIVLSASDYYPFGMAMKERTYQNKEYRYGFNGMEKDWDIAVGKTDFGARIYDELTGRWFSTDALEKKFTSFSPYSFTVNNPIYFIDIDGDDIVIAGKNGSSITIKTSLIEFSTDASSLGFDFGGQFNLQGEEVLEAALDIAGIFDPTGTVDVVATAYYASKGDWFNTTISGVSILPFGDVAKLVKVKQHYKTVMKAIDTYKSSKKVKKLEHITEPLSKVNKIGGTKNCVSCVDNAAQSALSGEKKYASKKFNKTGKEIDFSYPEFKKKWNVSKVYQSNHLIDANKFFQKKGSGSAGFIAILAKEGEEAGHILNIFNDNGVIRFVDEQLDMFIKGKREFTFEELQGVINGRKIEFGALENRTIKKFEPKSRGKK